MKTFPRIILMLIAAAILSPCTASRAQDAADTGLESVWLAGKINGGYMDFTDTAARDSLKGYAEKYQGGFDIDAGAKIKKGAFPAIQAGPLDAWGGNKTYPLRLHFKLGEIRPGGYVLTAGLAGSAMRGGGKLEIDVNGSKTSEPVKPGKNEEALSSKLTSSSASRVVAFIPSAKLKTGDNTITITVTEGAWVIYDYIMLESLNDAARPVVKEFSAVAPPFLAKDGKGGVGHALRVECFFAGPTDRTTVSVALGGKAVSDNNKIKAGWNRTTIILPEQKSHATATVKILAVGKTIAEAQTGVTPVRHLTISLMPHSHLDIGYPDIQPNIVIDQKTFLENALDMIDKKTDVPMKWVVEASWPLYNLLKGKGAYDIYGPWMKNTPLTQTVPDQFWKDTATMRDSAFNASVTSSASPKDALNNRRAVDGSVMGWSTGSAAKGAWIQLDFPAARKLEYLMLRQGREALNPVKKIDVTFTGGAGKTSTASAGPLGVERERLSVPVPQTNVKSVRIEIADVEKPEAPASFMEIETWQKSDQELVRKRAIKAIKDGRMEVSGLYMNYLTGFIPTEWLIRSMLRSHEIAKLTGVPIRSALITDVPGFSFAMPDVLSGSGVKYFYTGINPDHAPNSLEGMPRAFWWIGPGGGKILVFRSFNDYNEGWRLGFTISADEVEKNLPGFLAGLDEKTYPHDSLPLRTLGDITDDGPVAEKLPDIVAEWNRRWAYPKLEIGLPTQFFESFEKKYAATLPTMQGDWTGFWEDGIGSSALETANARARGRLGIANEAWAGIASRKTSPGNVLIYCDSIDDKSDNISWKITSSCNELDKKQYMENEIMNLYYEHTWGADASISAPDSMQTLGQWVFKQLDFESLPEAYFENTHAFEYYESATIHLKLFSRNQNLDRIFPTTYQESSPLYDFHTAAFFNPSSFARDVEVQKGFLREPGTKEVSGTDNNPENYDVNVISLPSFGVKYYEYIEPEKRKPYTPLRTDIKADFIENKYYKIKFDAESGAITSIYDKEIDRELNDPGNKLGFADMFVLRGRPSAGTPAERDEGVVNHYCSEMDGYLSCTTEKGSHEGKPGYYKISRVVRLSEEMKKVDILYEVNKQPITDKESLYIAFPFSVPGGEMRFEVTGGVMTPEKDQLPGASRDWISVQDGIGIVSDDYSVLMATPDVPLVVPGDIHVLEFRKKNELKNTTLYSWPMNNYWHTNYKASQGGRFNFRYAVTSMKGRAKDSDIIRFGEEVSQPALAYVYKDNTEDEYSKSFYSKYRYYKNDDKNVFEFKYISLDKANVRMLGLKKAEDGYGLILRLQEVDGADTPVTISLHPDLKITKANVTNLVEDNGAALKARKGADGRTLVDCKVPSHGYLTVRLK